jgi:hypothetical protein
MDPFAVVAGLLGVGMGLMALTGWWLSIDALKSIIPGLLAEVSLALFLRGEAEGLL